MVDTAYEDVTNEEIAEILGHAASVVRSDMPVALRHKGSGQHGSMVYAGYSERAIGWHLWRCEGEAIGCQVATIWPCARVFSRRESCVVCTVEV